MSYNKRDLSDDDDDDFDTANYPGKSKSHSARTPQKKFLKKNDSTDVLLTPPSSTHVSDKVHKMMANMGYDGKRGLGTHGQGRVDLVEESKQKGRKGLGFSYTGFSDASSQWDFENDPAIVQEDIQWCPIDERPRYPLNLDEIRKWMTIGPAKTVIDDEIDFADEELLQNMLSAKSIFDELPQKEMEEARARSNVYEIIGQSIFLNRAAVKMANIDSVTGRLFTNPKRRDSHESLILPNEPFYFADVCAGPGGFSEYILWKRKWTSKGFGFTLKGPSDFNLRKFLVAAPEIFDPHYGVDGSKGDGNIFKLENITEFQAYVMKNTANLGVHIVMADGGFSVEGQENIQEILSKQLYLCQFLTALSILRPEGNFVCKLFDVFTPFSVGLIYLMYCTFDRISIHKPVTSRPANSERYIICERLRAENRDTVRQYMYEINEKLHQCRAESNNLDVLLIVPMEILKQNNSFYSYIRDSNNRLAEIQIRNLQKIRAFVSNSSLVDSRQNQVRTDCLRFWELPDEPRQKFQRIQPQDVLQYFEEQYHGINNLFHLPNPLTSNRIEENCIESLFDYRCVLSMGDPVLLLSCGGVSVHFFELKNRHPVWKSLQGTQTKIELPAYTLLLAERIQEKQIDSRQNRSRPAFHLIDAYFIAKENLLFHNGRPTVFTDRLASLKLFEKVINKPVRTDLTPIRVSQQYRFEQMDDILLSFRSTHLSDAIDTEKFEYVNNQVNEKPSSTIIGLWLFKFVQCPWLLALSRSRQQKYFYNKSTGESTFVVPADGSHAASLKSMLDNSFYWDFNDRENCLSKSKFIDFIHSKKQ